MADSLSIHIDDICLTKDTDGRLSSYDPYKALAAAICLQAFDDLKARYAGKERNDGPLPEIDTLERFFRGDLYKFYSGHDDGEKAIAMAKFRGEYEQFRFRYNCKKCPCTPKECIHRSGLHWDEIDSVDIFCPEKYKTKVKKTRKKRAV